MRLHARNVAQAAGCPPELIEALVEELISRGNIKIDEAERILSGDWSTTGGSQ
jgi:hydroxymethylglutaryl-CoA reductase